VLGMLGDSFCQRRRLNGRQPLIFGWLLLLQLAPMGPGKPTIPAARPRPPGFGLVCLASALVRTCCRRDCCLAQPVQGNPCP